jgi:transposase
VAGRFADPAVPKSLEVDLALLTSDDQLRTALELSIVKRAKHHDATTVYRLRSVPGVGKMLALVMRYAMHDLHRFPSVGAFVSSSRLVKCATESAGKRYGTSGQNIGTASLTWAFSEAAVLCLRHHPVGQKFLATLANTHGQGKALTILAHKLARAVYDRLTRQTVCAMETCLPGERAQSG